MRVLKRGTSGFGTGMRVRCLLLLCIFVWRAGAQTCPQTVSLAGTGVVTVSCPAGSMTRGSTQSFSISTTVFPVSTQFTINGLNGIVGGSAVLRASSDSGWLARFTYAAGDLYPFQTDFVYTSGDYVYTCAVTCVLSYSEVSSSSASSLSIFWSSPVVTTSTVVSTTSQAPVITTSSSTSKAPVVTTSSTTSQAPVVTTSSTTSQAPVITTSTTTSPAPVITTSTTTSPAPVTTSSTTRVITTSTTTSPAPVTTSSTTRVITTSTTSVGLLEVIDTTTNAAAADAGSTSQTLTATGDPAETFPVALVAGVGGGVLGFLMLLCCCWACMSRASTPSMPRPAMPRSVQSVQPAPSAPPASSAPPGPLKPMEPVVQPVVVRNGERLFSSMPVMWDTQCPECMMYGMCHACWYKSNYDNIRVERLSRYRV